MMETPMSDASTTPANEGLSGTEPLPGIKPWYWLASAAAFGVMGLAIWLDHPWLLNFVHVMAGVLWTGTDLLMGFVVGPALRSAPFEARRAVSIRITTRTILLLPTLAIITGTSGWYHARQLGLLDAAWPQYYWVVAALVLAAILTIQGLLILLPANIRVYRELRKLRPDPEKIGRVMRFYLRVIAIQGMTQVAMIVAMARFVTGL
jgi:uncharacterized membrane protein